VAFAQKGGIGLFEVDLSALMDELGFDALTSPTHSPVIDSENSSQSFFVSSTEFGMIFKVGILFVLCYQAPRKKWPHR
jgi:hypothetical protein